ncbi:GNAT family N-acetyltransferase [Cellulophaga baltica]|uniref:GNAT family N-acetyltransferase n=1 Tax=Cellulophaga TaxID=104264 RepID=UPI001C07E1C2|nr:MULTISPECIES: GNAT family N-acetyltransferase [Cellulophaga]MBU2997624.1 GNAT family N-acetyltransferase [Cellulophaga baltica]MDO6769019.1 GNAT family N-acetyltransferase [Cellulophaga sp. 1_MG-2023]
MNHFIKTLKNPVLHSLNETHEKFKISFNGVDFYDPEICPFGAFTDASKTAKALNSYGEISESFFLVSENETPIFDESQVALDRKIEGCQMVLDNLIPVDINETITALTEEHIDAIYDLIWLVMPGYYRKRTFEMGNYYGIFKDKKLVAIAGQRLQTNEFIEISAVVTHPEYTRRGLAKQLVYYVTKEVLNANKKAILHTTKGNAAIKLYEKLGYKLTRDMNWWYFHKK